MRFALLALLVGFAPRAAAQTGLSADLVVSDSLSVALARFGQSFTSARLSMPDSVDVLSLEGWKDVRDLGVPVMTAAERAGGWLQVLPQMECDSDARVILNQLFLTAGQLMYRTSVLADALEAVAREAAGTGAEAGVVDMEAAVRTLGGNIRRAVGLTE